MTTPIISLTTSRTAPTRVGAVQVSLEARAWRVRLPFGGLVWNRPTAVIISQDGAERRLPIVDVTRRRLLTLLAIGLVCLLAAPRPRRGP